MVRITKVHTGGGDGGETSLVDGSRVGKEHPRVAIYGTIDEANSAIGIVRAEMNRTDVIGIPNKRLTEADQMLGIIQQELFDVGGECAGNPKTLPDGMVLINMEQADRLVSEMDEWTKNTPPLDSFILPAGSPVIVALHVARTIARRAERCAVRLTQSEGDGAVRPAILAYLNRLSDWFFVACRHATFTLGEQEVLWIPLSSRGSKS